MVQNEPLLIHCGECGRGNDLGRVFCMGCGKRLPANGVDAARIRQAGDSRSQGLMRRKILLRIAGTAATLVVVLLFWTRSIAPGTGDDLGAARRFQRSMSSLVEALDADPADARITGLTVTEEEINAYVRHGLLRGNRARQGAVRITPSGMRVLWRIRLWDLDLGLVGWQPFLSLETTFVPDPGGLKARGARVGRLPLPGALGAPVRGMFERYVRQRDEWKTLQHLNVDELGAGRIALSLRV